MIALLLLLALQQPAAPPATTPARPPATPPAATTPARRPPVATGTITMQVRVTNRSGAPAPGVRVVAEGPSTRDAVTDSSGSIVFRTMSAGTYRLRATGDGFITLEKETAVRAGTPASVEFALSAAPPPPERPAAPAPPPPAPAPAAGPSAPAGEPRVISVPDLAEKSLGGRDPVRTVPIGCSGLSNSQLLVVREASTVPAREDVDEMLYVVAGEATLSMAGKDQSIMSGWFSVVPRGTPRTITRKGRNPAILLSVVGGQPCNAAAARR